MQSQSVIIDGNRYKLSGTLVAPDNTSTKLPAVVFYHGMVSKSKPRYVKRAGKLAQKGIAALCFDFRGCGESDGKLGELSLSDWLSDALLAYDYLAHQSFVDKERIGISGKSFGGYMASLACAKRKAKSIVLQAPGLYADEWFEEKFQWTEEFMQKRIAYRNSKDAFNNRAVSAIQQYKNPLLIIGSEFDEFCPQHILDGFYKASPAIKKKLVLIKGADHALTNEKHNEKYTQMMTDWFRNTL